MATELKHGATAPDFSMPTDDDQTVSLTDLKGRWVVLYFYPKDDTPGCTKEAIQFTDAAADFEALSATVIGVSKDPVKKHKAFKTKHALSVRLASDEDGTVCEAYGCWVEKSMYGRKYMGIERSTFLIDPTGTLVEIWRKVRVAGHSDAVLARLQENVN